MHLTFYGGELDGYILEGVDLPLSGFAIRGDDFYAWHDDVAVAFDPDLDIWVIEIVFLTEHGYEVPTEGHCLAAKGTFYQVRRYAGNLQVPADFDGSLELRPLLAPRNQSGFQDLV